MSVTVNGLGERAGNTALEQLAMVLDQNREFACKIDPAALYGISRLVADAAGEAISPTQPVVGDRVFSHESGIHCHAMFKDTRAYEPFDPAAVGRGDRRFVLGAHSGASAIHQMMAEAGIHITPDQAAALRPVMVRWIRGK